MNSDARRDTDVGDDIENLFESAVTWWSRHNAFIRSLVPWRSKERRGGGGGGEGCYGLQVN